MIIIWVIENNKEMMLNRNFAPNFVNGLEKLMNIVLSL